MVVEPTTLPKRNVHGLRRPLGAALLWAFAGALVAPAAKAAYPAFGPNDVATVFSCVEKAILEVVARWRLGPESATAAVGRTFRRGLEHRLETLELLDEQRSRLLLERRGRGALGG